jgi:uncharacterized protein YeaO (DUF488 family)
MLNIKRVNVKDKVLVENVVYIGRTNKTYNLSPSPLANPYVIGRDGDRDEVVEKYRQWLRLNVQRKLENPEHGNAAFKELKRLQLKARDNELTLMCWCKSNEKCHGDIIINCLNWMEISHIGE